jgi:hypothetical protein
VSEQKPQEPPTEFDYAIYPPGSATLLWPKPYDYLARLDAMERIKAAHEVTREAEREAS